MPKVINNFKMGKYLIMVLDNIDKDFKQVEVDGKRYDVTIPYDIPSAIAIKTDNDFIGKSVNFI